MIDFVGPNSALQIMGVKLVGVDAENGRKLLFTLVFILAVYLLAKLLHFAAAQTLGRLRNRRIEFWTRQAIRLTTAVVTLVGVLSIWFDDPTRLATALGLVTAGLAFALQRVVTAIGAYLSCGRSARQRDRAQLTQTTIMEMGQRAGR